MAVSNVPPADLDIAVLGQLSPAQLPLDDAFEPGSLKVVGFEALLWCRRLQQEALYELAQSSRLGQPSASPAKAAQTSIDAYQNVIGSFPAGPLATVLSAFANFG